MVEEFFGLKYHPFTNRADIENRFVSSDIKLACAMVEVAAEAKGICMLNADPGKGLSYTTRCATRGLHAMQHDVRYHCCVHGTDRDFYKAIVSKIGAQPQGKSRQALVACIHERAMTAFSQGKPLFLVIDHAETIPDSILADLSSLTAGEYGLGNVMTVLLCGTRDLKNRIGEMQDERLRMNLQAYYVMQGLSEQEVQDFIVRQFKLAGGTRDYVQPDALTMIHSLTFNGNYKEVNKLMQDAMLICLKQKNPTIDVNTLRMALSRQKL